MKKIMDNKKILLFAVLGILLLIAGVIFALNFRPKEAKKKEDEIVSKDKLLEDATGFTKEDAINEVKKIFTGDNYKFEATTDDEDNYIVTATNIINDSKTVFIVDPQTGTYYIDMGNKEE